MLLLLLSGLAAGSAWPKEVEYYGVRQKIETGTWRRRTWYTLEIQTDIRRVKTRKRLDRNHQLIICELRDPHAVEVQYPRHWKLRSVERTEKRSCTEKDRYPLPATIRWLASCVSRMASSSEQSFAAAMAGLQATLSQLVQSQRSAQWSKWVKSPDTFKPESRAQELQMWDEWKFGFTHYVKAVDPEMGKLLDQVSANPKDDYEMGPMEETTKTMAVRLYGMLVTHMRGRPLQLIRHLRDSNGFKAWNIISKEMEPSTRQRSLALLTQLSRVTFAQDKTITEQIPAYDSLVREYERVSGSTFPDDSKIAAIMLALPLAFRTQIQMIIDESTTYSSLVERIQHYEAVTTKWESKSSLLMPTKTSAIDDKGLAPMEVDQVAFKGKGKSWKGHGGKGKWSGGKKGDVKGFKGKTKKGGKFDKGKGLKGRKGDSHASGKGKKDVTCYNCGQRGHMAKDCWQPNRVQQVEEEIKSSAGVSTTGGSNAGQSSVKQVRLVTPPDVPYVQIFDLEDDEDYDHMARGSWADWSENSVNMVTEMADVSQPEFYECEELEIDVPAGVPVVALHLQDEDELDGIDNGGGEVQRVCMISSGSKDSEEHVWHEVTLDSGADLSVLPMSFLSVGEPVRDDDGLRMVDAQGKQIQYAGITRASLLVRGWDNQEIIINEKFVVGNVKTPLLCAGKMLRQGWEVKHGERGLCLSHEKKGIEIPLKMAKNSLQLEALISMVTVSSDTVRAVKERGKGRSTEATETDEKLKHIRVLNGLLSRELRNLEKSPGWHRLPNGVVVYSDAVATSLLDPRSMMSQKWKCRMTLMKENSGEGMWQEYEKSENIYDGSLRSFRSIAPGTEPQRTLTFLAPTPFRSYWEKDNEVPLAPYPQVEDALIEIGWDDDDDEVEAADDTTLKAEEEFVPEAQGEENVKIDNHVFSKEMTTKQLRTACQKYGLPQSGTKWKLLQRLEQFKAKLDAQMETEVATKLYQESLRRPVQIKAPKLPSVKEQEEHALTHIPFASWCEACLATRSKEDPREKDAIAHEIPVVAFDYGYTYTKDNFELDERFEVIGREEHLEHPKDQFGTMLVAAASETKAILAIPIAAKGSINLKMCVEELVRFGFHNCGPDGKIVYQADKERSCKQLLKAIQQVRAQLGLKTEIRTVGENQHQSNGQAERAIQTIRRFGNCLRKECEQRAEVHVGGTKELFPWCFRHAAWLVNRFRVLEKEKHTSYELMYGRKYQGSICLFGESVLFKAASPFKGDDVFKRGIWVGKSNWSDTHIVLTQAGAVEARSVRRLPDQFHSLDVWCAKGLPWAYTGLGVLMKHGGHRQRPAQAAEEITEEEMLAISGQIARGINTPGELGSATPGPRAMLGASTPAPVASPATPFEQRRSEIRQRDNVDEGVPERGGEKKQRTAELPPEGTLIQEALTGQGVVGDESMSQKGEKRMAEAPVTPPISPKRDRLYAPGFAGDIRMVEVEYTGEEEEEWLQYSPEVETREEREAEELKNEGWKGTDEDHPPEVSDEVLSKLDEIATDEEVSRLEEIPVMVRVSDEEARGLNMITTRVVLVWKRRQEKQGWFRRARLVARQFRTTGGFDDVTTFAPTSASMVPRLMLQIILTLKPDWEVRVMDIKDAFLMAWQPEEEANGIIYKDVKYRLVRCLPGQRTAARQWYLLFRQVTESYGGQADSMQPTLFKMDDLLASVHVDDVLLVGGKEASLRFIKHLKGQNWKLEIEGPFNKTGDEFSYLKRKYQLSEDGIIVRPDSKHVEELVKLCETSGKPRKTPCRSDVTEVDVSEQLDGESITHYRSIVGKLMYIAGERPDAQFGIHCLAKFMKSPTTQSLKHAEHMVSYLAGTSDFGVKLKFTKKGRSLLDRRLPGEVESQEHHLLEIITDADYAGNKVDRKSVSCTHCFMDGNLIESRVRSQKSIALSSGESEFVAIVSGCSEALFLRHLAHFMGYGVAKIRSRSDSSAARAMCAREGVGRVRHIDAGMFWIQQRVHAKEIEVKAIPTAINPADIGTKSLSRSRSRGLMCLIGMVDGEGESVGQDELAEIEEKMTHQKQMKQISGVAKAQMARMLMLALLSPSEGASVSDRYEEEITHRNWTWIIILLVCGWALGMAMSKVWNMCMSYTSDASLRKAKIKGDGDELSARKILRELGDSRTLCRKAEKEREEYRKRCHTLEEENAALIRALELYGGEDQLRCMKVCVYPHGKVYHLAGSPCQWAARGPWYGVCQTCFNWREGSMLEVPRGSVTPETR